MRKKKIIISIGLLLVVIAIFYFSWNTNTMLGEVHKSVKQTGMLASEIGIILNEKEEVKISVKSRVDEGDVLITLRNEKKEILYTFDADCTQKENFTLEAGNYSIRIDSEKCRGKFDIIVRK